MGLRVYNLFPRYYENCLQWAAEFPRIKDMGFNAVYVNPFHYAGFSGSLYAPKDYYSLNPICIDAADFDEPLAQLKKTVGKAREAGLKIIMDLVINHTSKDHPFVKEHPSWYVHDGQGQVQSPGAWENGRWVTWGDLAQVDNISSPDRESLWAHWEALLRFYSEMGFDGFRADAAYQIPAELWRRLIGLGRSLNPNTVFLAESLGCTPAQSRTLAEAGFDYLFNSAKWWDFSEPWFIEQYNGINAPMVAFPESHDTQRAAAGLDPARLRRLIAFTGLVCSAWMIVTGTEWGWTKKTDVVSTSPADKEGVLLDLTAYIKSINTLRERQPALGGGARLDLRDHESRESVVFLQKTMFQPGPGYFYLINKTGKDTAFVTFSLGDFLPARDIKQIFSSEGAEGFDDKTIPLKPWELKLFRYDWR